MEQSMRIIETATEITKDMGEFSAAHQLPTHSGKCRNLHGHNYRVLVTVRGPVSTEVHSSSAGMVIDFGELKRIYNQYVFDLIDHALILGTIPLDWIKNSFEIEGLLPPGPHEDLAAVFGKAYVMPIPVTTAENIARWIQGELWVGLKKNGYQNIDVTRVEVFETSTGSAAYITLGEVTK